MWGPAGRVPKDAKTGRAAFWKCSLPDARHGGCLTVVTPSDSEDVDTLSRLTVAQKFRTIS